ncbi:hypothetical protein RN001_008608 [Aquatica leii]|uniref:Uncharacterized protein n=1 Tax=Aquatica leii TaxID=1421715 RepID=A0AAN7PZA7_9COLE|nr:hypothetical protein RN001_008608 [Aquatica leii]
MNQIYGLLVLSTLLALGYSAPQQQAKIVSQSSDTNADGGYKWSYETDHGVKAEETGSIKKASGPGAEDTVVAQGSYEYKDLEGKPVHLTYIADENGFQPAGAHLPTPPPVPEAILKALAWIAAHPSKDSHP